MGKDRACKFGSLHRFFIESKAKNVKSERHVLALGPAKNPTQHVGKRAFVLYAGSIVIGSMHSLSFTFLIFSFAAALVLLQSDLSLSLSPLVL